jgi:D-serine deaminase-like pyridoxal phosphate-dependent protein
MNVLDLESPAFLIDAARLERNSRMMLRRSGELGVQLRPHVKTHKSVEIARLQLGGREGPVTVSTLAEARAFSQSGFEDITYAVPISPQKLASALTLAEKCPSFSILLDSWDVAKAVEQACKKAGLILSVFLKVDSGYHRAGVDPSASRSVDLAKRLEASRWIEFKGILTHAGHSYHAHSRTEIQEIAELERSRLVEFGNVLRSNGIACSEISVGSTPTAVQATHLEGVTEMRPGNYIFFDKFQADIGTCSSEDCAVSIITRIIGVYPETKRVVIDAGALALSKDPGAVHVLGESVFGLVLDHPSLKVTSLSQEHGIVVGETGKSVSGFRVGDTLRILPNHSCLAAALHPWYFVVEGQKVVDRWRPIKGW